MPWLAAQMSLPYRLRPRVRGQLGHYVRPRRRSEDELQPKLDLARRRYRARDVAPVGRNDAVPIRVDVRERDPSVRNRKIRMVRQVEHLRPKLEPAGFIDRERLRQRKIEIDDPRSDQRISTEVAARSLPAPAATLR